MTTTPADTTGGDPGPDEHEGPGQTQEQIERAALDAQCLALHRTGATYRDIAARLQVSHGRVANGIRRARDAEPALHPDEVRADLSSTLDRSMLELVAMIGRQDTPPGMKVKAINTLVSVVDRKAKLHGADAPVRRQIDVTVFTPEALAEEQSRLERELEAAGVDVATLPSVDDIAQIIDTTATVVPKG